MKKIKMKFRIDGEEVSEEEFERRSQCAGQAAGSASRAYQRPLKSVAAAVHPTQAEEFNKMYREAGIIGAHHDSNGTLVFESRKARRQVGRLRGVRDNDAGYGDYAGR